MQPVEDPASSINLNMVTSLVHGLTQIPGVTDIETFQLQMKRVGKGKLARRHLMQTA